MSSLRFTQTRALPFRVVLKISLLTGVVVVVPLYTVLVWAGMGYPMRGAFKGGSLLLLMAIGGWMLWRFVQRTRFRRGGPGAGPDGPKVREPRPPGGRPPVLSAAARVDEGQE